MNEAKAARYQRARRRACLAEAGAALGLLAAAAFGPVPIWVPVGGAVAWQALAHRRDAAIRLGAVAGAAVIVLAAMAWAGSWWWLAAAGAFAAARVAAARLMPRLLVRVGGTRPVARRSLMAGLRELARRSGVEVSDILEWRSGEVTRATALVTGLGQRCRVFVSSELLRDWSDDEIAVVVAHELAHHVHRDLWRTVVLDTTLLAAAFGAAEAGRRLWEMGPTAAWPVEAAVVAAIALMASAVWLAATPIRLAQSRAQERRADRFALGLTGEAGAFKAAVRRLGDRHLSDVRPAALVRWFFHRHPPVGERLAMAETFNKATRR